MKGCLRVILWFLGITMLLGCFGGFVSEKNVGNIALAFALLVLGVLSIWGAIRLGIAARRQAERAAREGVPPPTGKFVWGVVIVIVALSVIGFVLVGKCKYPEIRRTGFAAIAVLALLFILIAVRAGRRARELYRRCYLECDCGFKGVGQLCNNYSPWISLLLLGFDRLLTAMWYTANTNQEYVKCPRCGKTYYPRY